MALPLNLVYLQIAIRIVLSCHLLSLFSRCQFKEVLHYIELWINYIAVHGITSDMKKERQYYESRRRKNEGRRSSSRMSTAEKSLSLTRRDSSSRFLSHRWRRCIASLTATKTAKPTEFLHQTGSASIHILEQPRNAFNINCKPIFNCWNLLKLFHTAE